MDGPGLVGLEYANGVEAAAALANQAVFDQLEDFCNPGGLFDNIPSPSTTSPGRVGACTSDDVFFVYLNARELVHSANELRAQGGPTVASLGVDQEGLGLALRWTAAEEFAAQGSMATEFANGQLSNLAARMTALRFGATGFGTSAWHQLRGSEPLYAQAGGPAGEDGEADEGGAGFSRWGGFLNASFGYGEKTPTALEDAFDFDGSEITLGVDYRLGQSWVLGGIFGFSEQAVDFDEAASFISVVDGTIDSDGDSVMVFAMLQGERLNLNASIGTQSVSYEVARHIKYPSFNPNTDSVYSIANSEPEADVSTITFGVGYGFTWGRFTMEPFFSAELLDATVDSFAERRSINLIGDTSQSRRFDLLVSEQDIESFETTIGFRFQYVVTPRFGVIVPYVILEAHSEHEDDSRTISAQYAALQGIPGFDPFVVPTDVRDDAYTTATAGFSMILRGGRQRRADGPVAGGLSGFFQLKTIENLENFDDRVITGGFRYEF